MANKHMKNMLNIISQQENATQNHNEISPYTHIRMPIIKMTYDSNCWLVRKENGTLVHCWWECKTMQLLWEI